MTFDLRAVGGTEDQQTTRLRIVVQGTGGEDRSGLIHLRLPLTVRGAVLHPRIGIGTVVIGDGEDRHM